MKAHLSERYVKAAQSGEKKTVIFDDDVSSFGVRLYPSGRKSFVIIYRINGRQRWYTIGDFPDWSVSAARERAKELKRDIDRGVDPQAEREEARAAPTVRDMIDRFIAEHLPKLAPRNAADQKSMLKKLVEPEWGSRKVADITSADVDRLLTKIAEGRRRPAKQTPKRKRKKPLAVAKPTPIRANRVGEVLRKMFTIAMDDWKMRPDNPAKSFHRRTENERERFLSMAEIDRLSRVMELHENERGVAIIRMLLLTGARLGEVRQARFDQFDLELAIWTKPAATTKQRRTHRMPLSSAVVAFVRARRAAVPKNCPWLFPGDVEGQPVQDIRRVWNDMRTRAGMPDLRLHDLRHTFASLLISGGASLPMVGKLLGHSQAKTTQRYAHLMDDPLRQNMEALGDMLRPKLRLVATE